MEKYTPEEIVTKLVNRAFISVQLPDSNNSQVQQALSDLYIANAMASLGNAKKKAITDELKTTHAEALSKAMPNQQFELERTNPFVLSAKVSKPRNSFDKYAFIKAVADEYDLSMSELLALSKKTMKTSAAPVSFDVIVDGEGERPF